MSFPPVRRGVKNTHVLAAIEDSLIRGRSKKRIHMACLVGNGKYAQCGRTVGTSKRPYEVYEFVEITCKNCIKHSRYREYLVVHLWGPLAPPPPEEFRPFPITGKPIMGVK